MEIKEYVNNELNTLWDEYRRLSNPQTYKVDLSRDLWNLKTKLIDSKKLFNIIIIRGTSIWILQITKL